MASNYRICSDTEKPAKDRNIPQGLQHACTKLQQFLLVCRRLARTHTPAYAQPAAASEWRFLRCERSGDRAAHHGPG